MPRVHHYFLLGLLTISLGCQETPPPPATNPAAPRRAAVELKILVVEDPPLAAGIKLLRGEWSERSGGELSIQEWTLNEMFNATELSADLIVYPSRLVGTLVDRGWLRPVRASVQSDSELALDDIFAPIRDSMLRYGGETYPLTLGDPPLMHLSSVSNGKREIPRYWEQVEQSLIAKSTSLKYPHAAEFLARGIAYTQNPSPTVGWFEVESMQPQLTTPQFERALRQMVANANPAVQTDEEVLALGWPGSVDVDPSIPLRFSPLPRAEQVYDPLRKTWQSNDSEIPLVLYGFGGRSMSVSNSTRNSASAFKLLTWLASESTATQLSPRSPATVWFRKSQLTKVDKWLASSGAESESTSAVTRLLTTDRIYQIPRVPGIDEYLQALEAGIERALAEELTVEGTLAEFAAEWNSLTDRYGRDRQRVAYRKHLGLEE